MDKTEGWVTRSRLKLHQRSEKELIREQGGPRVRSQHELIQMLHVKLQSIEEDTKHMKKAVARCVEERSLLMSEITRQLHYIEGCLVSLQGGDSSAAASSSVLNSLKNEYKTIGLSEVLLLQDTKETLVTRDIKVDLDVSQDLAWYS